ncbi:enoyl-CoA hydratase-related protein [Eubacteriaceae bacterium ES2]|nr:enoyl-CoA hydratase-related protein [Eubacteriaceae bacterium ES2]
MEKYILSEINESIAVLTIDREKALNALNPEVLKQLKENLLELDQDASVKVIILTGSGSKAFVAGADISSMQSMSPVNAKKFSDFGQSVMNTLSKMSKIVIAAVNGYALGGGCELAMACDIRVASENAKFGIPEVTLGVIPGFGGTQRLPRLIGMGKAIELLATGGQVDAQKAYRIGLANHVVEPDELMNFCLAMAKRIAKNSVTAIALGKECMYTGTEIDLASGLQYEGSQFGISFATEDQYEGMSSFLAKRKPEFKGVN